MSARLSRRTWLVVFAMIWLLYLAVSIATYFQRHDLVSVGMMAIGAVGVLISYLILRSD
jgi:hypothetical protein